MHIIGSFNLRDFNFSNYNEVDNERLSRDFDKIAQIIRNEHFDVVALQEINAELPLKYLVSVLNRQKNVTCEYEYVYGTNMPFQHGRKDPERYGFIWNNKRLRLLNVKKNNNPGYYENAGTKDLLRPPYYARFTARGMLGGSNFELRLVNTHIYDAPSEKDRIEEFNVLVKRVLPRICEHQELSVDEEFMPAYTFLLGDYNLVLNKGERAIYRIEKITTTNYTGRSKNFVTVQEEKTSLKTANGQTDIEDCYSNNYDHFTYDIDLETKLILIPQRIEALTKYMTESGKVDDKLKEYRMKVSDHVPIKLEVNLK